MGVAIAVMLVGWPHSLSTPAVVVAAVAGLVVDALVRRPGRSRAAASAHSGAVDCLQQVVVSGGMVYMLGLAATGSRSQYVDSWHGGNGRYGGNGRNARYARGGERTRTLRAGHRARDRVRRRAGRGNPGRPRAVGACISWVPVTTRSAPYRQQGRHPGDVLPAHDERAAGAGMLVLML